MISLSHSASRGRSLAALLFCSLAVASASAETSVGVSIGIDQPGLYGRIDIGNAPPPPVVYAQPVLIAPPAVHVQRQPIYLYVPPGHQKKWAKHCAEYGACNRPVYFVQEQWVRERHGSGRPGGGPGHGHGKGKGPRGHDD